MRNLHVYLGLGTSLLLSLIAISGSILSTKVLVETMDETVQIVNDETLHQLISRLDGHVNNVISIKKTTANAFIIKHRENGSTHSSYIDIHTGQIISEVKNSEFYHWINTFHRSLLLAKPGKILVGISAIILFILALSGLILSYRKYGGWQGFRDTIGLTPRLSQVHDLLGILCLIPLIISTLSALYLSFITLGWVPNASDQTIIYPETPIELPAVSAATLTSFKTIPLNSFNSLIYPIPGDWFDVYTVKTNNDIQFFDQFTGQRLSQYYYQASAKWSVFVLALHSATIAPFLAIVFGLTMLPVPFFGLSGFLLWLRKRRTLNVTLFSNVNAEVVILVGSESSTTWQFSSAFAQALSKAGYEVYLATMNQLTDFPHAHYLFVMSATYGNGGPPQNANQFLPRLMSLSSKNHWQYAVLGFGDTRFEKYCHFPTQVMDSLAPHFKALLPFQRIDKQCQRSIKQWVEQVGLVLEKQLTIEHTLMTMPTVKLSVKEKSYFNEQQHAIVKLTIECPRQTNFNSGDLLAINISPDNHPRYYSIAKENDRKLAIFVSIKRPGLGAEYLNNLNKNHQLKARIINNTHFHAPAGNAPLILIAAGTGVAPFIGFIEQNKSNRPISLFYGCQHQDLDFVINKDIKKWQKHGKLQQCHVSFSKGEQPHYIQDVLQIQEDTFANSIRSGAVLMICGSQAMYQNVYTTLNEILTSHRLDDIHTLKQQKRFYSEVY